jgi:hypothetical protein
MSQSIILEAMLVKMSTFGPSWVEPEVTTVRRLSAGGRWIRTSSTRAPINRVIPLLWCPIAWDELACARVQLGSHDLTRKEISVNLFRRDRLHGLKEPARGKVSARDRCAAMKITPSAGCRPSR